MSWKKQGKVIQMTHIIWYSMFTQVDDNLCVYVSLVSLFLCKFYILVPGPKFIWLIPFWGDMKQRKTTWNNKFNFFHALFLYEAKHYFFRSGFVKRQIYWQSCVICITVFLQITLFHVFMFFQKLTPYNGNYFKGKCHNVSGYKIQKKHFCLKNLHFL